MENMFEYATRNKVRFPFKGQISVEDLWDLRADDLDTVFKTLNRQVKQSKEESLLTTKTAEDTALDIQIAIVKHIFDIKMQEANASFSIRSVRLRSRRSWLFLLISRNRSFRISLLMSFRRCLKRSESAVQVWSRGYVSRD